jgi:hypothetical protein
MSTIKKDQELSQTTVMRGCAGTHYNFKKGTEVCPNRLNCKFFDKDFYARPYDEKDIRFIRVKEFRNCNLHKE